MQSINNNLKNIKDSKKKEKLLLSVCVCRRLLVKINTHHKKKTKLIKIKARTTTYLIKESK